jgi:tetratricopeptide (TPR) repeat protein
VLLRLALLAALVSGLLVAYLTSTYPSGGRMALAGDGLLVLTVGIFLAGATLGFVLAMLRDVGRGSRDRRRAETLDGPHPASEPDQVGTLRGRRDVAAGHGRWSDALQAQEQLLRVVPRGDRAAEEAWLAGIQYEIGRALLGAGDAVGAQARFRDTLRARPDFQPAALSLGDALVKAGDPREARHVWERALELGPIPPLLARIEQLHRADGRPARVISLYQDAARRHPGNLAVAFGLGRACFELTMLDEAAEQFQKLEVQAPDLPSVHAYLGAIFERRGQVREAFEEYRRALRFPEGLEWPHRCAACGATQPGWFERCPACRRWNTSRA